MNLPKPGEVVRIASHISKVAVRDIRDLRVRNGAALVRKALISAMHGKYDRAVIAQTLGLNLDSISAMRYQHHNDPDVKALADKIELAAYAQTTVEPPVVPPGHIHPGYSVVTASGITIRRCPATKQVLFHPHDKAFAALYGAKR